MRPSTARLIPRSALRSRTARLLSPFGRETPRGASGWTCVAECQRRDPVAQFYTDGERGRPQGPP
ncbi:MAG: hypothetical protein M3R62_06955, partial [Acidobacteriota bacterium]|nr:hypothetical protein [Acidobacteriota bacterium]